MLLTQEGGSARQKSLMAARALLGPRLPPQGQRKAEEGCPGSSPGAGRARSLAVSLPELSLFSRGSGVWTPPAGTWKERRAADVSPFQTLPVDLDISRKSLVHLHPLSSPPLPKSIELSRMDGGGVCWDGGQLLDLSPG